MMPPPDKNTSVFLDGTLPYVGDLSHAETRRGGEFFSHKEHKERKAGGPTSVSATIDRPGWKRVRMGEALTNVGWCNYSHLQPRQVRKVTQGDDTGEVSITTDYYHPASPVVLFGDHTCNVKYVDFDCLILGDGVKLLTPNHEVFSTRFLYYLVQYVASKLPQGYARHLAVLKETECALPCYEDQFKIANAITSIDTHIAALQSLIAKYEAIKKATVNLLLKPKAGWNKIRLADFESHRNNTCSRSLTSNSKGNIHNIHYGDILVNFGEIVSMKYDHVDCLSEEGEACSPKDYLQDGDIVIADTAEDETAGKVIEVQDVEGQKAVAGLHTVFLRPPSNLFARGWLGYWMNSRFYHDQLLPYMTGIKVLSLSKSSIANTEICYPAMEKQKHIVGILKSIDTHIATLQAQACKARQLKDGMMSYFFG